MDDNARAKYIMIDEYEGMKREDILFNNKMNEHRLRMEEARFRVEEHKMRLEESRYRIEDAKGRSKEMTKDKILLRTMKAVEFLDTIHEKKNIDEETKLKFVNFVKKLFFVGEEITFSI